MYIATAQAQQTRLAVFTAINTCINTRSHMQATYSAHAMGPSGVCTTNGCLCRVLHCVGYCIIVFIKTPWQHRWPSTTPQHQPHHPRSNTPAAVRWVYDLQALKGQKVASISTLPYAAIIRTAVSDLEGRCYHFLTVFKWAAHQSQRSQDAAHGCLLLAEYNLAR